MEVIFMARMKEYAELTVKELRDKAKVLNISGRWDMTKPQLIEAIVRAEKTEDEEPESATDEIAIDNDNANVDVEIETKEEKSVNINMEQKQKYLDNIQIGALVAFKVSETKAKSAKVIKKSTKSRKLMVETSYGATHVIPFEDVLWVRTGARWPKGVYNMLKGIGGTNEE
jgi:hypothetical protein